MEKPNYNNDLDLNSKQTHSKCILLILQLSKLNYE